MAGRGRPPKSPDERARRNKDNTVKLPLPANRLRGPSLPKGVIFDKDGPVEWHPRTLQWWSTWRRSPLAATFTATDWDFLLDTALMHHKMWANGRWDFAAELRLRVAKFGATPEDRARLKIVFEPKAEPETTQSAGGARSRYRGLRVVGESVPAVSE